MSSARERRLHRERPDLAPLSTRAIRCLLYSGLDSKEKVIAAETRGEPFGLLTLSGLGRKTHREIRAWAGLPPSRHDPGRGEEDLDWCLHRLSGIDQALRDPNQQDPERQAELRAARDEFIEVGASIVRRLRAQREA